MAGLVAGSVPILNMPQQQAQQPQQKGNFLTHLLPTIGGIGGGALGGAAGGALAGSVIPGVGTAVGGLLGALLGGAAGGAGGKVLENSQEGQALGNGVLKEGLTNGALSAGPLRLLKGAAEAGKVFKAGTGLADALKTGGAVDARLAAPSMFKTAVANKLDSTAGNMAQRATKINDSTFLSDFNKSTGGEPLGDFARRFGVPHNGLEHTVQNVLQPGFKAHADSIAKLGDISKTDILSSVQSRVSKQLASPIPDTRAAGQAVLDKANSVLANLPDKISATQLNAIKSDLSGLVKKGVSDGPTMTNNDILQTVGDGFRNSINQAATKAGVIVDPYLAKLGYKSTDVGGLGDELHNLKSLLDKAEVKSWTGSGTNPIGLTGAVIGGGLGGPTGAAAGIATQAINSTAGKRGIAKGIDALASRADNAAVKSASPYSLMNVAKRDAPVGLLGALGGANQSSNAQTTIDPSANSTNANISTVSSSVDQNATQAPQAQDNSPLAPQNVQANVQKMVQNGAKMKDIVGYVSLVESLQKLSPSQPKALTGTQAQQASNAKSGMDSLQTLAQQIQANPNITKVSALPGGSLTASLTGTGTYKAALNNATDVIGRLRSGGAINAEEQKHFQALLPQSFDRPETIQYKMTQLNNLFQRFANPNPASPDLSQLGLQ